MEQHLIVSQKSGGFGHRALFQAHFTLGSIMAANDGSNQGQASFTNSTDIGNESKTSALITLEQALTLAEPKGYVRTFVDKGEPLRKLLRDYRSRLVNKGEMTEFELANEVSNAFLQMLVTIVGIGLVITVQDAIVGEKQSGMAAWVMSKPASRSAFVVAKVIANIVGIGITAVIVPTTIFPIVTRLVIPLPVDIAPFLAGLTVVILGLLFYLMLALMLGTIYDSRSPIIGIGIGLLLAGTFLKGLVPQALQAATPWPLPDVAVGLALSEPLPDMWFVPLVVNGFWIVVFTAMALWRFSREEF